MLAELSFRQRRPIKVLPHDSISDVHINALILGREQYPVVGNKIGGGSKRVR